MKRKTRNTIGVVAGVVVLAAAFLGAPYYAKMMGQRRWNRAIEMIQGQLDEARRLAMAEGQPFAVEFDVADNGTTLWIESEAAELERLPDLDDLQHRVGDAEGIKPYLEIFRKHGGTWKEFRYDCGCRKCNTQWMQYEPPSPKTCPKGCPKCGAEATRDNIVAQKFVYDFEIEPGAAEGSRSDNARQGAAVQIPWPFTIVPQDSPNFFNWDQMSSVEAYGWDSGRDIRFGRDGRLVQTKEPVLHLYNATTRETRLLKVEHHSGRLINETPDQ